MDIFEPTNTANNTLGVISLSIGLVALIALIFLIKNPPKSIVPKFRPLAQLLVFIIFLLGICTAFFSFWTNQKLGPVTITEEYLETSRGRVAWKDIDRIYVHEDQQLSPLTSQEVGKPIRFLMIVETKNARTHALSEENYDLDAISAAIRIKRPK